MTLPIQQEMIDLLGLEPLHPSQNVYGFKGYYPVLDTSLMWYNGMTHEWKLAQKVKISKNLEGWYYYGVIPCNNPTDMTKHLIRLKRQIEEASLYVKKAKIKNKLNKIKEDFQ